MVTINGSALGCIDGVDKGVGTSGTQFSNYVVKCSGNPSGCMVSPVYSGLAYDITNAELYMSISGTTNALWIHLGSVS